MLKKLYCKKHTQHLFYVYSDTKTGRLQTICQVCEDEAITAGTIKVKFNKKATPWIARI